MTPRAPRPPFARARIAGAGPLALSLAHALEARGAALAVDLVDPGSRPPDSSALPEAIFIFSDSELGSVSQALSPAPGALVHLLGSVQRPLLEVASRMRTERPDLAFVGGHPVLDPIEAAADPRDDLFAGVTVALCALDETSSAARGAIERTWQLLGALPIFFSAEEHDRWMALTRDLPTLAAATLAHLARESLAPDGPEEMLAGRALRDATRSCLAGAPSLTTSWSANRDHLVPLVRRWARILEEAAEELEAAPASHPPGFSWLEAAVAYRIRFGDS